MAVTLDLTQMLHSNMFLSNALATGSVREPGLAIAEIPTSSPESLDSIATIFGSKYTLTLPSINTRLSEVYIASLLCMILLSVTINTYQSWSRGKAFRSFALANGCARTQRELPRRFLASFRNKLHLLKYKGGDLLDDVFAEKYRTFGETHALYDSTDVAKVVHTIDPVNVNTFLASRSQDYRGPANRKAIIWPLAQDGILATEGAQWLHHRKAVQRALSKGAKETKYIEAKIQLLFQAIGEPDAHGKTKVVDLLDLFFRMALDLSIQHLFGTTVDSQITGMRQRDEAAATENHHSMQAAKGSPPASYNEAYEVVRHYLSRRSKLGSKYWMADGPKYRRACAVLNNWAESVVEMSIERMKSAKATGNDDGKFNLVDNLVGSYSSTAQIREVMMDIFMAGQNMTAWLFAELEHHPQVYQQIRAEVLAMFGTEAEPKPVPMTWDNLRACSTLQHAMSEVLRRYPLLPLLSRNALVDTVLPRGGSPDGSEPIAIPKGTPVTCCLYLMHRREQEWGPDADVFNPERWNDRKFGPEYAPFGAGARSCIGQQLSMTEISYATARIVQHYEHIQAPAGQDNLENGYRVLVQPKNGVRVTLKRPVE